jgi:hypothetical protein
LCCGLLTPVEQPPLIEIKESNNRPLIVSTLQNLVFVCKAKNKGFEIQHSDIVSSNRISTEYTARSTKVK